MTLPLRSSILTRAGIPHGFSTRIGGVSEGPYASLNLGKSTADPRPNVRENLRRFEVSVGGAIGFANQVHGNAVFDATDLPVPDGCAADALMSSVAGRFVGVKTADCVPVLLAIPGKIVAAVHAGWRGTALGIVAIAAKTLCDRASATSRDLLAAIGPCIGGCCYEVGDEVVNGVRSAAGAGDWLREAEGKPHVDLAKANAQILTALGVEQIDVLGGCTGCQPALFFSHRRDHGVTGRMACAIAMR